MRSAFLRAQVLVFGVALAALVLAGGAAAAPSIPQYTNGAPISDPSSYGTSSLQAVDVNADGNLDLVETQVAGPVEIMYGDGAGAFSSTFRLGNVNNPDAVGVFDVDGDGRKDLVVVGESTLYLVPQNPDGTFGHGPFYPAQPLAPLSGGNAIAVGDVNDDGHPDVVASTDQGGFVLFLGNGSGFDVPGTVVAPPTLDAAYGRLGDVNGDGFLDLVTNDAGAGRSSVDVRFGNGDGTFGPPVELAADLPYQDVALGDVNGDGIDDIVVAGAGDQTGDYVAIYTGHRDGTFALTRLGGFTHRTNAAHVTLADLNGDGSLDIFASDGGTTAGTFLNDGHGGFVSGATLSVSWYSSLAAVAPSSGRPALYTSGLFEPAVEVFEPAAGDTAPPVITVPAPITAEATSSSGAAVTFSASASDDTDGTDLVTCAPASGSVFPLGATTVACTATDAAGNEGSATFAVTVVDTTAPALTLPSGILADATSPGGASVSFAASATDAVDGNVPVSCSPASGTEFPAGDTTVTCTAGDAHGNTAIGSFSIHVRGAGEQIDALVAATAGHGPGASLQAKAAKIQARDAAGDVSGTCSLLGAFASEVSAQSGKSLDAATADALAASARRIGAILGC